MRRSQKAVALVLGAAATLALGTSAGAQTVVNGTFDANDEAFTAGPGYVGVNGGCCGGPAGTNPDITGFTNTGPGGAGINGGASCCGPFAPAVPTDGAFAFIQGQGGLTQEISGFTVGTMYQLTYQDAARAGDAPDTNTLTASIAGQTLTTTPTSTAFNTRTLDFTATASTLTLAFTTGAPPDDQSIVIDNVSIGVIPEPASLGLLALGGLGLLARRRQR